MGTSKILYFFFKALMVISTSNSKPLLKLSIFKTKKSENYSRSARTQQKNIFSITNQGIICYQNSEFNGKIDLNRKIARLELKDERNLDSSLNLFLKVIYSNVLLNNKGILLHSANLVKNNKGYCFFGRSGSGKTTISKSFSSKGIILSDDIVVIRKINKKQM